MTTDPNLYLSFDTNPQIQDTRGVPLLGSCRPRLTQRRRRPGPVARIVSFSVRLRGLRATTSRVVHRTVFRLRSAGDPKEGHLFRPTQRRCRSEVTLVVVGCVTENSKIYGSLEKGSDRIFGVPTNSSPVPRGTDEDRPSRRTSDPVLLSSPSSP